MPVPSDWSIPIPNEAISASRTKLNNALELLQSNFYGSNDPATDNVTTDGMIWVDTTPLSASPVGPAEIKMRSDSDATWTTIGRLSNDMALVRKDGTTTMTGSLVMNGNGVSLSPDGNGSIAMAANNVIRLNTDGSAAANSRLIIRNDLIELGKSDGTSEIDFRDNEWKDPKSDTTAPTSSTFRYINVDIGGALYKITATRQT